MTASTVTQGVAELAARMRTDHEQIARSAVALYKTEIVDYAAATSEFLEDEVLAVTLRGFGDVLDNLAADVVEPSVEQIAGMEAMLMRRPHQGVALASMQQAFQVFSGYSYGLLPSYIDDEDPVQLRAALRAGEVIFRYTHEVIQVVTQTYLDELQDVRGDREIVSRNLLDAVLAGRATSPSAIRDARLVGIDLGEQTVVLVARAPTDGDEGRPRTLRTAAKTLRQHFLSRVGPVLVGVREKKVVCLCPVKGADDVRRVVDAAHAAAAELDALGMCIGVAGWRQRAGDVPSAYAEACEAADQAIRLGVHDRAMLFDDVLLDRVLRTSDVAERIVTTALDPLRAYDAERKADLVATLQAYVDTNFGVAATARAMTVHNNTVLYRLERIRLLTGRDPRSPRDIVFLALALRLQGA
ncbi:hypothetical protein DSM112329_00304 [Paraconexibacter sp. AEG42_29]|uniref:PucR family transcriptional regulator n=1 Tax=Paraconexibacter sp. AEG42_29 TaxID=2997339 RepID=A0AAU7AQ41_9ACTN